LVGFYIGQFGIILKCFERRFWPAAPQVAAIPLPLEGSRKTAPPSRTLRAVEGRPREGAVLDRAAVLRVSAREERHEADWIGFGFFLRLISGSSARRMKRKRRKQRTKPK
jgi:hypothetical protein